MTQTIVSTAQPGKLAANVRLWHELERPNMPNEVLTDDQIASYRENGYVLVENRLPTADVERCRAEIDRLSQQAAGLTKSNDEIDLEESHTPESPRVRRIKLPHRQSAVFDALMRSDLILAPVRDLIGPDLRLHTSKLNMKASAYGAPVEWHQDWAFYPHTNDDVLAVGVMLDDVSADNGPLMVFPGTHRAEILDHHTDGVFQGALDLAANGLSPEDATAITAPAGSISIHHARIIHGSDVNRSGQSRRMLFYEITAADAFPVVGSMSPMPSLEEYDSRILCGRPTITPRLSNVPVRIPLPRPDKAGSIYELQIQSAARSFT